jgi:hypothetical protein
VKRLNKKILGIVVMLLAVAVFVTPLFGMAQACSWGRWRKSKTTASFIVVTEAVNAETVWERLLPSEDNPQKEFEIAVENPSGIKVNIGGELVESAILSVYAIDGGTTYVLGTDFTYEGTEFIMIDFDTYPVPDIVRFTVRYSYTFLPASGIQGTLTLSAKCYYDFEGGEVTDYGAIVNGYGTGDLRGVVVKAEWGPPIIDPDYGVKVATHEGTITGFPIS